MKTYNLQSFIFLLPPPYHFTSLTPQLETIQYPKKHGSSTINQSLIIFNHHASPWLPKKLSYDKQKIYK